MSRHSERIKQHARKLDRCGIGYRKLTAPFAGDVGNDCRRRQGKRIMGWFPIPKGVPNPIWLAGLRFAMIR